jgi:hypothetical protein
MTRFRGDSPDLTYVPARPEPGSGTALAVAMYLLTLLVWMLSAR